MKNAAPAISFPNPKDSPAITIVSIPINILDLSVISFPLLDKRYRLSTTRKHVLSVTYVGHEFYH